MPGGSGDAPALADGTHPEETAAKPENRSWSRPIVFAGVVLGVTLGTLVLLRGLAEPLTLLFIAIVIAESLAPVVIWLQRWMQRTAAIIAIYVFLLALAAAFFVFVVPPLLIEVQQAVNSLPKLLSWGAALINRFAPGQGDRIVTAIQPTVTQVANSVVGSPSNMVTGLGNAVQVVFLSLYWLVSAPELKRFTLSLVPASRHKQVNSVLEEMSRTMGGYVRGTVIDAIIVGLITYVGLLLLNVKYPLLLAVIAAAGEFIPIIGPTVAEVLATAMALLISPARALIVLAFYLIVQQVDGNVIFPLIVRQQANLSPLLITFAVFTGAWVDGVIGALVAIPLAGVVQVLFLRVVAPQIKEWTGATA